MRFPASQDGLNGFADGLDPQCGKGTSGFKEEKHGMPIISDKVVASCLPWERIN